MVLFVLKWGPTLSDQHGLSLVLTLVTQMVEYQRSAESELALRMEWRPAAEHLGGGSEMQSKMAYLEGLRVVLKVLEEGSLAVHRFHVLEEVGVLFVRSWHKLRDKTG